MCASLRCSRKKAGPACLPSHRERSDPATPPRAGVETGWQRRSGASQEAQPEQANPSSTGACQLFRGVASGRAEPPQRRSLSTRPLVRLEDSLGGAREIGGLLLKCFGPRLAQKISGGHRFCGAGRRARSDPVRPRRRTAQGGTQGSEHRAQAEQGRARAERRNERGWDARGGAKTGECEQEKRGRTEERAWENGEETGKGRDDVLRGRPMAQPRRGTRHRMGARCTPRAAVAPHRPWTPRVKGGCGVSVSQPQAINTPPHFAQRARRRRRQKALVLPPAERDVELLATCGGVFIALAKSEDREAKEAEE